MKPTPWISVFLFSVVVFATFSAGGAWAAKDCGDDTPAGSDTPCDCGDTVTSDTVLDASDPVVNAVCSTTFGLLIAGGVKLDAGSLNMRCATPEATIGLFITGPSASIRHGIISGCGFAVEAVTNNSTIERVTGRGGRGGFFIVGDNNTVTKNLCFDHTVFGEFEGVGISVDGDGNQITGNYCRNNRTGAAIALFGDHNTVSGNMCHGSDSGINFKGNFNKVAENHCRGNSGEGIVGQGSFNAIFSNRGVNNGVHGVFVNGGNNVTDGKNYATGNRLAPQCSIDGNSTNPAQNTRC